MRRWAMGAGDKLVFFSLGARDVVESLATAGGRCWGWRSAEIHGKDFLNFISAEDRKIIRHAVDEVRGGREPPCSAARFQSKDGKFIPLVWRFAPNEPDDAVLGFAREFFPRQSDPFRPFAAVEMAPEAAMGPGRPERPENPPAVPTPRIAELLAGIMGHCDLASLSLPPGSPIQGYLHQIRLSSMQVAELTRERSVGGAPPERRADPAG